MSTQQLGKIGLVLLAVYLVVSSLSSIPSSVGQIWSLGIGSAGEAATSLAFMLLLFILLALLPGLWIISRRDRLAKAWFVDDGDSQVSVEPQTLLAVGLVLIGVSTLIAGLVTGAVAVSQFGISMAGRMAGSRTMPVSTFVQAGVHLVLGVALIRGSKPLSARFS